MTICTNCQQEFTGQYCSNCGHAVSAHRIDKHYITHEIQHLLHFEKGFLYTVKELLQRPGHSIREFLQGNRDRHMKPVTFLVVASLIYTLIEHYSHFDDSVMPSLEGKSIEKLFDWVRTHYAYSNIIMGIFIALIVKLLFRKSGYNFYEILILLMFTMGEAMLLLTIVSLVFGLTGSGFLKHVATVAGIIYPTWVFVQFFNKKTIGAVLKAFLSYLLGMIVFTLALIILAVIADKFFKP